MQIHSNSGRLQIKVSNDINKENINLFTSENKDLWRTDILEMKIDTGEHEPIKLAILHSPSPEKGRRRSY